LEEAADVAVVEEFSGENVQLEQDQEGLMAFVKGVLQHQRGSLEMVRDCTAEVQGQQGDVGGRARALEQPGKFQGGPYGVRLPMLEKHHLRVRNRSSFGTCLAPQALQPVSIDTMIVTAEKAAEVCKMGVLYYVVAVW
jgi:hypothetical protein